MPIRKKLLIQFSLVDCCFRLLLLQLLPCDDSACIALIHATQVNFVGFFRNTQIQYNHLSGPISYSCCKVTFYVFGRKSLEIPVFYCFPLTFIDIFFIVLFFQSNKGISNKFPIFCFLFAWIHVRVGDLMFGPGMLDVSLPECIHEMYFNNVHKCRT